MRLKEMINNHRAQHEIAGFIIIVVIVTVIGLVMLSLMIGRSDVSKTTSVEIENLLLAIMQKTSGCSRNIGYYNIEELIVACYNNKQCEDGRGSCDVLSSELEESVGKSLNVGSGINKGYEVRVEYFDLSIEGDVGSEVIPVISEGIIDDCEVKMGASKSVDVGFGSGVIDVELRVCKG